MAIDCMECGQPVHENAVKCPHCGKRSGAAPSKPTRAEAVAIAQVEGVRFYNELEAASQSPSRMTASQQAAAGYRAVASTVALLSTPDLDRPIPVRDVTPPAEPPAPPPAKAPDPAPPPGDQPRFLK